MPQVPLTYDSEGIETLFGSENLELGPCMVHWDTGTDGAGLWLGFTGPVTVVQSDEKAELFASQTGTAAENRVVTGHTVQLTTTIRQATLERMVAIGFLDGVYQDDDPMLPLIGYKKRQKIGQNDRDIAKQMTISKLKGDIASQVGLDMIDIYLCAPYFDGTEATFDAETQRELTVTFNAYAKTMPTGGREFFSSVIETVTGA